MKKGQQTLPMTRKWLMTFALSFIIFHLSLGSASAQTDSTMAVPAVRFGYVSYQQALQAMPEYAAVQEQLQQLRAHYDAETKRVEDEFNRKYEEFLDGMKDFPQTILQKRQRELQDLMERNVAFKQQSRRDLRQAETDALAPLRAHLSGVLAQIGREQGLALIINTDADACPYIDPLLGVDLNDLVRDQLLSQ